MYQFFGWVYFPGLESHTRPLIFFQIKQYSFPQNTINMLIGQQNVMTNAKLSFVKITPERSRSFKAQSAPTVTQLQLHKI